MAKKTDVEERLKHWAGVVGGWEASGASRKEFCRKSGIPLSTFGYWQACLRSAGMISTVGQVKTSGFTPVRVVESKTASAGLEIILRDGVRIAVREGFDPGLLRAVVATLSS